MVYDEVEKVIFWSHFNNKKDRFYFQWVSFDKENPINVFLTSILLKKVDQGYKRKFFPGLICIFGYF